MAVDMPRPPHRRRGRRNAAFGRCGPAMPLSRSPRHSSIAERRDRAAALRAALRTRGGEVEEGGEEGKRRLPSPEPPGEGDARAESFSFYVLPASFDKF